MGTKGKLIVIALLMSGIVALLVWSKNGDRRKTATPARLNEGAMEQPIAGPEDYGIPGRNAADPIHSVPADPQPVDNGDLRIETAESRIPTPPVVSSNGSTPDRRDPIPESSTRTYTVVAGDSLWLISKKVYGKGTEANRIVDANRDKISNPDDFLRVGTVLQIPGLPDGGSPRIPEVAEAPRNTPPVPAVEAPAPPATEGAKTYKVKSGDTLTRIAKEVYGDGNKWHQIYKANRDRMTSPDALVEGQELTIPAAR
ncbi:MAG: LysM peptidoglycan-binding domain-containing protein [Candidatus Brocadiae bacterium]|nr:LysM peptidoglycan-binding domain-containing protein [Candidatus Brocadiia bacterium]